MQNLSLKTAFASAVICAASLLQANPAHALTFDFAGISSSSVNPSLSFNQGGINLDITAGPAGRNVFQNNRGLGVTVAVRGDRDSNQIDSSGIILGEEERLNLQFSETVRLVSATFRNVQGDDEFRLSFNGTNFDYALPRNGRTPFNFPTGTTDDLFAFIATGDNDFFLSAVDVTAVPVPVAVLPGLVGLAAATIRSKKQSETDISKINTFKIDNSGS